MDNFHPSYTYENVLYVTNVLHLGNEILVLIKTVSEKGITRELRTIDIDVHIFVIYMTFMTKTQK